MQYSKTTGGFYDRAIHAAIPDDAVDISREEHHALIAGQAAGQRIVPDADGRPRLADRPPPTSDQIQTAICTEVQGRLDDFARTLGYDSLLSACAYATSANPAWQRDAQRCITARDETWAALFTAFTDDPPPASYTDIESRLPNLMPSP